MNGSSACTISADAAPASAESVAPGWLGLSAQARRGLTGIVLARLAVNGGIRVVYPFLGVIAVGLGVSLQVIAVLVASRSLAGLAGPLIARKVPAHRRQTLMVAGPVIVCVGCLLITASYAAPAALRITLVGLGFAATGVARPLFDLPMQTWVSAHVPPASRARALGITELSWALSLAVTVPLAGVLIEHFGWRSPFALVAAMAAAGAAALAISLPRDGNDAADDRPVEPARMHTLRNTRQIPTGLAVCVGAGLAVAAGEVLLIVYGPWLTRDFGLSVAQIGASTVLIVAAELVGEGFVVSVADRLGLCRALFAALSISATTYAVLGTIGGSVALAVAAIATLFVAFEITVVVLIAFASTIVHHAQSRARLLGAFMAAVACGNAGGALLAPLVFARGGIALSGAVSAVIATAAAVVLWLGSRPAGSRGGSDTPTSPQGYDLTRHWTTKTTKEARSAGAGTARGARHR